MFVSEKLSSYLTIYLFVCSLKTSLELNALQGFPKDVYAHVTTKRLDAKWRFSCSLNNVFVGRKCKCTAAINNLP
jgi:hypothetical protein